MIEGINKAMQLHEWRTREKMNTTKLARLLFPDDNDSNRVAKMSYILTGKRAGVKMEILLAICQHLKVDSNFIFGFESVHDNEYNNFSKAIKKVRKDRFDSWLKKN